MRRIESLVSSVWSNTMRDLEGDKGWGQGSVIHRTFGEYTESRLSLVRYLVRGGPRDLWSLKFGLNPTATY